jgi:hypothetical protein
MHAPQFSGMDVTHGACRISEEGPERVVFCSTRFANRSIPILDNNLGRCNASGPFVVMPFDTAPRGAPGLKV